MEWLELNIDTSHAGLDAVTDMLEQQGVTGQRRRPVPQAGDDRHGHTGHAQCDRQQGEHPLTRRARTQHQPGQRCHQEGLHAGHEDAAMRGRRQFEARVGQHQKQQPAHQGQRPPAQVAPGACRQLQ